MSRGSGAFAALLAVARADFLERVRRRSYLAVIGLMLWACFAAVPPPQTNFSFLAVGDARGLYTSAWFGLMFGMVVVFLLPLPGFYLVRGAVERDRETRVGPILAATPLSTLVYLSGKAVSNLAVLVTILVAISLGAAGIYLLRREVPGIDLLQLWRPMWVLSLPVLALVATLAVAFDAAPGLRHGAGNVIYFFLWAVGLGLLIESTTGPGGEIVPHGDFLGISRPVAEAQARVQAVDPGFRGGFRLGVGRTSDGPMQVVDWPNAAWRPAWLLERLAWLGPSLILLLGAVAVFDRFDPARTRSRRPRAPAIRPGASATADHAAEPGRGIDPATLPPVAGAPGAAGGGLGVLVMAELRLMLRRQPLWWRAGAAGLLVASVFTPLAAARQNLLPLLWIWPVLLWSPLGAREHRDGVHVLLASAPGAVWRPVIAGWVAGVLLALGHGTVLGARLLAAGDIGAVAGTLAGAAFVSALALALGGVTRNSRTFEAVYLAWWYLAANGAGPFDFMGGSPEVVAAGAPLIYMAVAAALLGLAMGARRSALQ